MNKKLKSKDKGIRLTTEKKMYPDWLDPKLDFILPKSIQEPKDEKKMEEWEKNYDDTVLEPQRRRGWHITDINQAQELIRGTKLFISYWLTQSRKEWQEELIGEVEKKYRTYHRKTNGNCSYCDLCQDECVCHGYNRALYDLLQKLSTLKEKHD